MAFKPIEILIQAKDEASKVFDSLRSRVAAIASISIGTALGNAITGIVNKVRDLAAEFVRANIEMEATRRAFGAIYKDAGVAESQIAFLRKTAGQAGVSFSSLAAAFKTFTASATAANVPIATQNDLFRSLAKAGAMLGLSGYQVSMALNALGQMASKGVVSMEELRQQLGDSLPGALSLVAKGLGITEAELIKLVESGGLAARDLFPALASSLKSLAGENDTLAAGWERLKSAITQALTAAGDAGGMQVMTAAVKALAVVLGIVMIPLQGFVEILTGLCRTIGAAVAAIGILSDTGTSAAEKLRLLKEVGSGLGESFDQADARMRATADGFVAVVKGSDAATASVQGTGQAAQASAKAAADLSQQWVSTGIQMQKAAADAALAAANAAKGAEATKLQGEALVTLARVRGDANALAVVEADTAQRNAEALTKVADARAQQLAALQKELDTKRQLVAGDEVEQKARAESLKALADKIAALTEETAKTKQAADAARAEALQRRAAADATQNHADQVTRLAREYAEALTHVREYEKLAMQGKKTAQELAAANEREALAKARLSDAYRDITERKRAGIDAARAELNITRTGLEAEMERARVAEQRARQMGNEYGVRQALIQQKEIEVKIADAEVKAAAAVAQAKIAHAKAQLQDLENTGKITDAKRLEIEMTIKAAEAEIVLAKARGESVKLMEEQLRKLRAGIISLADYGEAAREATGNMTAGWQGVSSATQKATAEAAAFQRRMQEKYGRPGDDVAASFDAAAAAAQRALKEAEKYDAYMASRFERGWAKDTDGNQVVASESQAELNQRIAALFGEKNIGNKDAIDAANLKLRLDAGAAHGVSPWAQKSFADMKAEYDRLALKIMGGGNVAGTKDTGTAASQDDGGDTQDDTPRRSSRRSGSGASSGAGRGVSYVSNITLGNQTTSLRLADASSQADLENLLAQLTRAKRASL